MSTIRRNIRKGFTLVEILIVVVILGILAAIVIPQFTEASVAARGSSLTTQLQTIRSQLELYQINHNGNYPTVAQLEDDWGVMVLRTDNEGNTGTTDGTHDNGPYLQRAPTNAFPKAGTDGTTVAADASENWMYDEDTGQIIAVVDADTAEKAKLVLNEDYVEAP